MKTFDKNSARAQSAVDCVELRAAPSRRKHWVKSTQRLPTVFIVDDDPAIVKLVTKVVEAIGLKAQSWTSADEFLQAFKPTGPGCLVLDVRMPGKSGLQLQKELARGGITLPIIIITGHAGVRIAVEAMKAGAKDFLEKPFRVQELCDNIPAAIKLDEENWQLREQREDANRRFADFTQAEREVMEMVTVGKTNKMIAKELGLSVRAVEDRRARMMKRIRVESREELLRLVARAAPPETLPGTTHSFHRLPTDVGVVHQMRHVSLD